MKKMYLLFGLVLLFLLSIGYGTSPAAEKGSDKPGVLSTGLEGNGECRSSLPGAPRGEQ